jgi:glycosyltransferase involved in cell wall biosynthesis
MYKERKIAVVVPAYNEAQLIAKTVTTIPEFIDKIIVVDDKSTDGTATIVESLQRDYSDRLILIKHEQNRGVGGAIKTGYKKALALDMDITAVMGGDAQMDPDQLPKLLEPIIEGRADYTKGNRLEHIDKLSMPKNRRIANGALTLLTKIASGYWGIVDPQNGYTAISKRALAKLAFDNIYDRYGCPNDILIELNIRNVRVKDVEMPPVYNDEESGIIVWRYPFRVGWLLLKGFFRRINTKYGGLHFHPLWLFYYGGIVMFLLGLFFSGVVLYFRIASGGISENTVLLAVLLLIIGFQSLLFALFFDMESNKHLSG